MAYLHTLCHKMIQISPFSGVSYPWITQYLNFRTVKHATLSECRQKAVPHKWLTIFASPPNPPELLPPLVKNFTTVDTALETTSSLFPDPPPLANNSIPSAIALLTSCSLDPPLEDPPDVNCLMTCKSAKGMKQKSPDEKGYASLHGSSTADRLGTHAFEIILVVCLVISVSQFFIIDRFLVFFLCDGQSKIDVD